MKKLFVKILTLLALTVAFASCQKEAGNPDLGKVVGEWNYTNGETGAALVDVYLVFKSDSTFDMYQKIGEGAYRKYTGTFTVDGTKLSGVYSNGDPWASDYTVSVSTDGLTLTSVANSAYVVKYTSKKVPESVLNHYDDDTKATASDEVPFL